MAGQKRYVVAYRYGLRPDPKSLATLREFVNCGPEGRFVRRTTAGRYVVEMTDQQMREFAARNAQFVTEPDQDLKRFAIPGLPPIAPSGGNDALNILVKDANTGGPVSGATIYGIGSGPAYRARTDEDGRALLEHSDQCLTTLIVSPCATYWSRVLRDFNSRKTIEVAVKPLLSNGAYDWGHRLMGFDQVKQRWSGEGIRVGVVDSGVSDQLQSLHPNGGITILDGQDRNTWNVDEAGHGTHCAGIIAASDEARGIQGGAPGAQVFSIKVGPGGFLSDLVQALEWCILNRMDIVNIGVESTDHSLVLAHVLRDAYEKGITCIAPAGDQHSLVSFPAAYPTVFGVAAIGRVGTFPEDSSHRLTVSRIMDWRGRLFAANFTNYGGGVDVCAPGVAIISAVRSGFACCDGTSMACSMVTSLVALVLEAYPEFRTGKASQVESVRSILYCASIPLGMPAYIQGRGLPLAPLALGAARSMQP